MEPLLYMIAGGTLVLVGFFIGRKQEAPEAKPKEQNQASEVLEEDQKKAKETLRQLENMMRYDGRTQQTGLGDADD